MSATSIAPRRKSEDWSMNKAKDDFLRALGSATPQESEATKALKRTSGELLRPYSANPALDRGPVGGQMADYAVEDDSGWGKLIVGTSVRIGETSSKTGKGIELGIKCYELRPMADMCFRCLQVLQKSLPP